MQLFFFSPLCDSILNKITPEKFDKLSAELLDIGLQSTDILKRVLLLIFNKALDDQKYSFMYARLCKLICENLNNYGSEENNKETVSGLHYWISPLNHVSHFVCLFVHRSSRSCSYPSARKSSRIVELRLKNSKTS